MMVVNVTFLDNECGLQRFEQSLDYLSEVWILLSGTFRNLLMKFEDYIDRKVIILLICRIRAKFAQQRNKKHLIHLLSNDISSNYHLKLLDNNIDETSQILNNILPPRKKWKKLTKKLRYVNGNRINTVDYNILSLLKTIEYYENRQPSEPFVINLNNFIEEIKNSFLDSNYLIAAPKIVPKLKGKVKTNEENICRPISNFNLKDRIIISITNKYLTDIFDPYFYSYSYAFRAVKKDEYGNKQIITHQDSIKSILDFRNENNSKALWVAECDICKFYDSVHHSIAKKYFKALMIKVKNDNPEVYDVRPENMFYKYLDCYSFVKNVLPYNTPSNWKWDNIPNGKFGWIEKELKKCGYYKNIRKTRIGVPQGGALSGLIANIILNQADIKINKLNDNKLFYARFCDDMVLIHQKKSNCKIAYQTYFDALSSLNLVPHIPKIELLSYNKNSFWSEEIKSKSPYKWSDKSPNNFPWFGFVGYEIHCSGDLRVRKRSIEKEKQKQNEVLDSVISKIKNGKRKSDDAIFESVANRLIGMSVGRVTIRNYKTVKNEMCWANGFSMLKDNKQLRTQLKDLDKNRTKQLSRLIKFLANSELTTSIKPAIITLKESAFAVISGISIIDSKKISDELVTAGVLNNKHQISNSVNMNDPNLRLNLSEKYILYHDLILHILRYRKSDFSKVSYYGKPFSYYYQIIERRG